MNVNNTSDFERRSPHAFEGVIAHQHKLVLVGCDAVHLQVLASLAVSPLNNVQVVVVSPQKCYFHEAMLPGFLAGYYDLENCSVSLEPWAAKASVQWVDHQIASLDVMQKHLVLDDGRKISYDWLSINLPVVQNRERFELQVSGASKYGRFVRPTQQFLQEWSLLMEKCATRVQRIAIVGAGPTSVEFACAIRQRYPKAAITLVADCPPLGVDYPDSVQEMAHATLKKAGITVLHDVVTAIEVGQVHLGCGARLACDIPLMTSSVHPYEWFLNSGLHIDAQGYIAVNAYHQSVSHPDVWASGAGNVSTSPLLTRSMGHAERVARNLRYNLEASTARKSPRPQWLPRFAPSVLFCGRRHAIATWYAWSLQGRLLGWLKDLLDRRFVTRIKSKVIKA